MIPLALAMMAYGGYQEGQAMSGARKTLAGQLFSNIDASSGLTQLDSNGVMSGYVKPGQHETLGQGYGWTSPTGEQYYLSEPEYQGIQSGDIDNYYNLYTHAGNYAGRWDMNLNQLETIEQQQANMPQAPQYENLPEWTNDPNVTDATRDAVATTSGVGLASERYQEPTVSLVPQDTGFASERYNPPSAPSRPSGGGSGGGLSSWNDK